MWEIVNILTAEYLSLHIIYTYIIFLSLVPNGI